MEEEVDHENNGDMEYENPGAVKVKEVFEKSAPLVAAGLSFIPGIGPILGGLYEGASLLSHSIHPKKKRRLNPSQAKDGREKHYSRHHYKYKFQHE
jgi:hypothetical protein